MATAILANRGIGFTPHLLRTFRSPKGEMVDIEPVLRPSILLKNSKYWDIVIDAMRRVVSEGTGRRFGKTNYSIAAKTGTAYFQSVFATILFLLHLRRLMILKLLLR